MRGGDKYHVLNLVRGRALVLLSFLLSTTLLFSCSSMIDPCMYYDHDYGLGYGTLHKY